MVRLFLMKTTDYRISKTIMDRLRKNVKSSISPELAGVCCVLKTDLNALIKQAAKVNQMLDAIDHIKPNKQI